MKNLIAGFAIAVLIVCAVLLFQQHRALEKLRAASAGATENQRHRSNGSTTEMEKSFAVDKKNNAKQFVLAMTMFAGDNRNQFPTNLNQMMSYFGNENWARKNLGRFEITYRGIMTNIPAPSSVIVVRETQPWPYGGKWAKVYGFADGHVEIQTLGSPENFDAFERQHMITPPPNQ
jgi:prepilin-type processing-associated H-X9-DG protein